MSSGHGFSELCHNYWVVWCGRVGVVWSGWGGVVGVVWSGWGGVVGLG